MKHFDVLIIGSGISSLASARILAKFGSPKIAILEQHSIPGGFLHCFKRFGQRFETGAHYIGSINKGEPFYNILNYLDVYHEDDYIDMDPTGPDVHYFKDHTYKYALGYQNNIDQLTTLFPHEKKAIEQYFQMIKEAAHSFPTYYFKTKYDQHKMIGFIEKTVEEVVNSLFSDPKIKDILYSTCILYGVLPQEASFGFHSIVQDSYIISSKGFKYGGEKLAQRFVKKIKESGGEFFFNHKVKEIKIEGQEVSQVICQNGEIFKAKKIISGIHPKLLFNMIPSSDIRKSFKKRLDNIEESNGFFGAFLTLKKNPGLSPLRNYYFHRDLEFKNLKKDDEHKIFPFFMTSSQRNYKGEGPFPVLITTNSILPEFTPFSKNKRCEEYKKTKEQYFQLALKFIEEKFPGFIENIDKVSLSSPLTNQHFNPSPTGSAYGIYHDTTCTGARGLGPRTHFNNLILTGQNTLFPGLLGASISAIKSVGHIVGTKEIIKKLSEWRPS
jgi:all-trans-retinol 13,14-reductase